MDKLKGFKKNGTLLVIILAVLFGFGSGIIGEIIARTYLFSDIYNIPFFGEINFTNGNYNGSNLIISGPKKVVVEQNTKVFETINSVSGSIVGVFKKNITPANTEAAGESGVTGGFNLADYYKLGQAIGQGHIITSDGWVITSAFIKDANEERAMSDYVVITKDKKVYEIDKFLQDPVTYFSFIHLIAVNNLPVQKFYEEIKIAKGQLVIVDRGESGALLTSVVGYKQKSDYLLSSDDYTDQLVLADSLDESDKGAVVYNLEGSLVGFVFDNGEVLPIGNFKSAIKSLLEYEDIRRASLGLNYLDLSKLISATGKQKFGALVYKNVNGQAVIKGSAAQIAGFKENDLITAIDNIQIDGNNNLSEVLHNYIGGEKINIVFLRDGEEHEVEAVLGELK